MFQSEEGKAINIYIVGYISLIFVGSVVSALVPINTESEYIRFNSIISLVFYGSLATLYIILFKNFWKGAVAQFKEHKNEYWITIIVGIVALLAASMVINAIYQLIGITETSENQESLNQLLNGDLFDKFALVMFAVFFAPVVEEMVFRMGVFKYLLRFPNIKPWLVILISSFLFGLIHVLSGDIVQIFYYAGLGAILGAVYYHSKNIFVPIGVHMLLNGFVTYSMLFIY